MILERVCSGGQTGVDQAAWRAAKSLSIPTSGLMPKGFRTESLDGRGYGEKHPEFAGLYGATQHICSPRYEDRTPVNVQSADVTLLIGDVNTPGSRLAYRCFREKTGTTGRRDPGIVHARPGWIAVTRLSATGGLNLRPEDVAKMLVTMECRVLNVCGSRESRYPGIGGWAERFLVEVFTMALKAGD